MEISVIDNKERQRFEMEKEGQTVFANYELRGRNEIIILHVETPPVLQGKGAAGELMEGIMAIIQAEKKKIVPLCSYARQWVEKHKEFQGLVML